jgi:hypothetical protein
VQEPSSDGQKETRRRAVKRVRHSRGPAGNGTVGEKRR